MKGEIEMQAVFTCKQCLKSFVPGPNITAYDGQSLCMMCRASNGEKEFTPEEKICLEFEKTLIGKKNN